MGVVCLDFFSQAHTSFGFLGSYVFVGPYINISVVLHKTFGVLCSRAQGPLLLMKQKR